MQTIIVSVDVYNHSTHKEYNYSYRVQSHAPKHDNTAMDNAFNLVRIVRKQLAKIYPFMDIEVVGGAKYAK